MPSIHLFNPENDLALAANDPNYTPPAAALRLRHAAALLPMWWARKGDVILIPEGDMADEARSLRDRYGLHGEPVSQAPTGFCPEPWGWSLYTRRLFSQAGVEPQLLPSSEKLQLLRELSHRRTAIKVHRQLQTPAHLIPIEAFSLEEAAEAIARWGRAVIKLPWSSSGRGVIYSAGIPQKTLHEYIRGIIHRQGSVMIEPCFDKIQDFATLFYCNGTTVEYRGISVFATDSRGCYCGNLLMPQKSLIKKTGYDISKVIPAIEQALTTTLSHHYQGPLGVDMLTYRGSNGTVELAPCIEVNMRNTMGFAAMHMAATLPCHDNHMVLSVSPEGIKITRADDR